MTPSYPEGFLWSVIVNHPWAIPVLCWSPFMVAFLCVATIFLYPAWTRRRVEIAAWKSLSFDEKESWIADHEIWSDDQVRWHNAEMQRRANTKSGAP